MTAFDDQADTLEQAADDLEVAARHLRTAARHFREQVVPRACAHAFAAQGLVGRATGRIGEAASRHASKANPD